MKSFRLIIVILIVSSPSIQAQDWKLVWSDEFEQTGFPDKTKWGYEIGFVRNRELQYYTDGLRQNTRVESGMLVLEARIDRFKNPKYHPDPEIQKKSWQNERPYSEYTSSSITTKGSASWLYGRIEVRAKLPTGRGLWPAIWMMGTNKRKVGWPACGEIDIMENVGLDPDIIHGTVHVKTVENSKHASRGSDIKIDKPYESFHVYAIEWFENRIDFFVDDNKYFTFKNDNTDNMDWPFDKKQYLILNVAIGGSWAGKAGIDQTVFPQMMYVDYVRVYERNLEPKRPFWEKLWDESLFVW